MSDAFDEIFSGLTDGNVVPYLGPGALAGVTDPHSGWALIPHPTDKERRHLRASSVAACRWCKPMCAKDSPNGPPRTLR